ncbi:MAG: 50S ribosomal protein L29 [Verrucomicrobia bacterium]|nr:MAG: 50S ribosomal protein L29 [Verrucomicrobiota bacterium]
MSHCSSRRFAGDESKRCLDSARHDRSAAPYCAKRRDLRQESLHLRLQQQSGQLEQPSRLRLLRRDVARIETALAQRVKQTEKK